METVQTGDGRGRRDQACIYVDAAHVVLVGVSRDQRVTFINQRGRELLGYSEEEILGQNWFDRFIPEREREQVRSKFDQLMAGQLAAGHFEIPILAKGGEERLFRWHKTVVRNERGEIVAAANSGEDITEHRQLEEALRAREASLRLVTEQVPAILWAVDRDLRLTLLAGAGLRTLGLPTIELVGRTLDQVPLGYGSAAAEPTLRALEGKASMAEGEFRGRWYEVRIEALRDGEGRIVGSIGLAVDVTVQHQATARLRASEAELRALFASMNDLVLVLDSEGRHVRILPTNPALLPQPAERLLGKRLHEVLPREQADLLLGAVRRALGSREVQEVEYPLRVGQDERAFSAILSPISEQQALCVARDITCRKHADEERARLLAAAQEARAEAERANRAKDQFLVVVSHEMRAPLSSVLLRAEHLLRKGPEAPSARRTLESIRKSARDLSQLIDDLLDVSRIATGKIELHKEPLELSAVVDSVIETMRASAEEKGLLLSASIDPVAGVVEGDPRRLRQVLTNLLSNSLKFTPRGGRVSVRLERQGGRAVTRVSDTGVGIAASEMPKVFSRFYQARRTASRSEGLGLGLALVRHFVELHGGTVEAESPGVGQGSTFTVTLPLMQGATPTPFTPSPSTSSG